MNLSKRLQAVATLVDINSKVIGTNNPRNVVYATMQALQSMQTVEAVAKKRGKKASEIL